MGRYLGKRKVIQVNEAIAVAFFALLLTATFLYFDLFDRFADFIEEHEEWQLDELIAVLFSSSLAAFVLLLRRAGEMRAEIGRRERAEGRANELARHDPLTGLANRRRFNEELATALERVRSSGEHCAVFLIDLDRFKAVNDVHGHATGDLLLIQVADRLREICDAGTVIARLGGDEFVCILRHSAGAETPARLAGQIVRALGAPFAIGDVQLDIAATVGVARCPTDATSPSDLLRAADIAMYEGKKAGRGIYRFFHAEMDARLRERAALESELRDAIAQGQIRPYFQPIHGLAEDRVTGFEALARWHHPTRGLLGPDLFIPIAEDVGVIDLLTYQVLRAGCIAARDWPPYATLSINISPLQLKDPWLSARLLAVLSECNFPPARLIVEVTENAIIDDLELAAEVFTSLQNAGIRIALDDFGKGYASLYHLRQLRFDHLKIDSSFVLSMDSAESEKIVRAITALGKSLGMPVTAEGVESDRSAQALRKFGCEQAQGYLFGAPVEADKTAKLFKSNVRALRGDRAKSA